jgi:hypothetical protein
LPDVSPRPIVVAEARKPRAWIAPPSNAYRVVFTVRSRPVAKTTAVHRLRTPPRKRNRGYSTRDVRKERYKRGKRNVYTGIPPSIYISVIRRKTSKTARQPRRCEPCMCCFSAVSGRFGRKPKHLSRQDRSPKRPSICLVAVGPAVRAVGTRKTRVAGRTSCPGQTSHVIPNANRVMDDWPVHTILKRVEKWI